MARKNYHYIVEPIAKVYKKSYPLHEVKPGTKVTCLENAPQGSLDVIDVLLPNGKLKNVYSFQLVKPVRRK